MKPDSMLADAAMPTYSARKRYPSYVPTGWLWPTELPSSWKRKRLKNLAISNLEVLPEETPRDFEIAYIDISGVDSEGRVLAKEAMLFGDAPSRARRVVGSNNVLISTVRTYLRAIAFVEVAERNLIASTGFAVLKAVDGVIPRFLYYMVRSHEFVEMVVAHSDGVSYPAIAPSRLVALPAWLPSIEEQQRIADFLDARVSEIDATLEVVSMNALPEYRSALISAAVTGRIDVRS
jgi:type I restriction enzyme, S subunit